MERIKYKPSLILCGDFHLREDTPICFTGDFQLEQWNALQFIKDLQLLHDCDVILAGDMFHHWKPSPWLLSMTMEHLPKRLHVIYGQHDLPQHNWELRTKSGIYALEKAGRLTVFRGCHFGQEPEYPSYLWQTDYEQKSVLAYHHLTYITEPYPGATGGNAYDILKKYPYDLIVCGDNHCSFTIEYEGRRLVNTGNLTRQTASQIDFKPCVWLWYAENNTVEQVFLPIEEGIISREHLVVKEERDKRIDAFISRLDGSYETTVSFEQNLEMFFQTNEVEPNVKQIIYKSIE